MSPTLRLLTLNYKMTHKKRIMMAICALLFLSNDTRPLTFTLVDRPREDIYWFGGSGVEEELRDYYYFLDGYTGDYQDLKAIFRHAVNALVEQSLGDKKKGYTDSYKQVGAISVT
jgi:hypothetical protein